MSAINHLGLLWESKQTNHQNKYWHCTCTFYISLCSLLKFYVVTTLFLRKQRAHTIGSLYFRKVIKVKCFDFYLELPNSYFMFAWMVPYKVCSSHFIENTGCIRALNSCLFHNACTPDEYRLLWVILNVSNEHSNVTNISAHLSSCIHFWSSLILKRTIVKRNIKLLECSPADRARCWWAGGAQLGICSY